MKKFIFVIVTVVIICVLGVSLAGCNRATPTQKLLSNSRAWTSDVTDETLVYDVIYKSATKDQVKGTMTVNVKSYDKEKVEIGNWSLDNAVGYVATTELVMDNGDVKKTTAFFTTTIQVKYAECTQTIGGVTGGYTAEYKNEKCYYTTTDGSDKGQGGQRYTLPGSEMSPRFSFFLHLRRARRDAGRSAERNYERDKVFYHRYQRRGRGSDRIRMLFRIHLSQPHIPRFGRKP